MNFKYSFFLFLLLFALNGCGEDSNTPTTITTEESIPDIDNTPPLFSSNERNVTIDENQLFVLEVSATDENTLSYTLESGDYEKFDINSSSGVITFRNLAYADYEQQTSFAFQVSASDGYNVSTQNISLFLNNLNDNPPMIEGENSPSVYENSLEVASYIISDVDDDNITVSLNNDLFDYNQTTKYLSFKVAPDYEKDAHQYSVSIIADDSIHSVSKDINITLLNITDALPSIDNFTGSIDENSLIGTTVGTVPLVSSGDSNIISYSLSGVNSNYFTINSSGVISSAMKLDFENISQYNLSVIATNSAGDSDMQSITININDINEKTVPTLVVIMNWNDYSVNNANEWYDKIFNKTTNSVVRWYEEATNSEISLTPISESSGNYDDGVIIVNMGVNHPGGSDDTDFRDTYIKNAITSYTVSNSVDFASLDKNRDGDLDISEIQIIFIVAGGEMSYGDSASYSIWAHSWAFWGSNAPKVDGVSLMRYNGDILTSGSYSRFGANHGDHPATIGIIAHELGHAMLNLHDFYDDGGGSGLGWYDIMSDGSWAKQDSDIYDGATPTQFTTYNKNLAGITMNIEEISSSQTISLKCSSNDAIKLNTLQTNEYFFIECRDTTKANSDISMNNAYNGGFLPNDNSSFRNKLFTIVYHVDDSKTNNTEDGTQTSSNHYNISVLEKDTTHFMTSSQDIQADYNDILIEGELLDTTRTTLYDGSATNYSIEVLSADYTNRTVTIKIIK